MTGCHECLAWVKSFVSEQEQSEEAISACQNFCGEPLDNPAPCGACLAVISSRRRFAMRRLSMGNGRVNGGTRWFVPVLMFALMLGNMPAHAQETKAATAAVEEQARSTLM